VNRTVPGSAPANQIAARTQICASARCPSYFWATPHQQRLPGPTWSGVAPRVSPPEDSGVQSRARRERTRGGGGANEHAGLVEGARGPHSRRRRSPWPVDRRRRLIRKTPRCLSPSALPPFQGLYSQLPLLCLDRSIQPNVHGSRTHHHPSRMHAD
jgi:hypothetical protein